MMMRPRNYSVLNRSIARGITYALRDMDKYKSKNKNNTVVNKITYVNNVELTSEQKEELIKNLWILGGIAFCIIYCMFGN